MKKEIINTIRLTLSIMIIYILIDLVNWKEVLPTIDLTYILRMVFMFVLVGLSMFFINRKYNKYLSKMELEPKKQQ